MDILEYIKKYYCRNVRTDIQENDSLTHFFDVVLKQFSEKHQTNIDIIYIKSTNVYPCKLTFSSSKKHYIIWDAFFWKEFEKYYQYMLLIEFNVEKQKDVAINNIASIVKRVLSYETENYPFVSFNLAVSGIINTLSVETKSIISNIIENELNSGEYLIDIIVAKTYVFFHEKTHIEYRTRNSIYLNDLLEVLEYFKLLMLCRSDPEIFKDFDNTLHEILTQYFKLIIEEIKTFKDDINARRNSEVEELLCDFYAFREIFTHFKHIFHNIKQETILASIFTSATYVTSFELLLKYQTIHWTRILDYLNSLDGNYERIKKDNATDYFKKTSTEKDFAMMRNMVAIRLFFLFCKVNYRGISVTGYFVSPIQFNHIFNQITQICSDLDLIVDLFIKNKRIKDKSKDEIYSLLNIKDKILDF